MVARVLAVAALSLLALVRAEEPKPVEPAPPEPTYDGRTVAQWSEYAEKSADPGARQKAADALARLCRETPAAAEALSRLLVNGDVRVFAAVRDGFRLHDRVWGGFRPAGLAGRRRIAANLMQAARSEDAMLRGFAIGILIELGQAPDGMLDAELRRQRDADMRHLRGADRGVRKAALTDLTRIGIPDEALPDLIAMLDAPEFDLRKAAIDALPALGRGAGDALPALRRLLGDRYFESCATEAIKAIEAASGDNPPPMTITYVIDCTGSMDRFSEFLKRETAFAVNRLKPWQRFNIVAVNGDSLVPLFLGMVSAGEDNKQKLFRSLQDLAVAGGPGDVSGAFRLAFEQNPDQVVLLSDGDIGDAAETVRELNRARRKNPVRVSAVGFVRTGSDGAIALQELTDATGGKLTIFDVDSLVEYRSPQPARSAVPRPKP